MKFWSKGQKTELAASVGISISSLSHILHRRQMNVPGDMARNLEIQSEKICGVKIPYEVWRDAFYTRHPAFYKQPKDY